MRRISGTELLAAPQQRRAVLSLPTDAIPLQPGQHAARDCYEARRKCKGALVLISVPVLVLV